MPISLFGVIAYPIGIPVFVLLALRLNLSHLHYDVEPIERKLKRARVQENLLMRVNENVEGRPEAAVVSEPIAASARVQAVTAELEKVCGRAQLTRVIAIVAAGEGRSSRPSAGALPLWIYLSTMSVCVCVCVCVCLRECVYICMQIARTLGTGKRY